MNYYHYKMVGIDLKTHLDIIKMIGQIIDQEELRMILDRNPTNIVYTLSRMVILGNNLRRSSVEIWVCLIWQRQKVV